MAQLSHGIPMSGSPGSKPFERASIIFAFRGEPDEQPRDDDHRGERLQETHPLRMPTLK